MKIKGTMMTPDKAPAPAERRNLKRIKCIIPVDYVVKERAYRDFIENISREGAFISTKRPVSPGTELIMTFAWRKTGQFIKSNGIVIRKNRKGFAVVFPQPLAIQ
jgi:AICAR transformylase/IMP cyclohydrolase PurH